MFGCKRRRDLVEALSRGLSVVNAERGALRSQLESVRQDLSDAGDLHDKFVEDLCRFIPEHWEARDGAPEPIVVDFVKAVTERLVALGGSLDEHPEPEPPAAGQAFWPDHDGGRGVLLSGQSDPVGCPVPNLLSPGMQCERPRGHTGDHLAQVNGLVTAWTVETYSREPAQCSWHPGEFHGACRGCLEVRALAQKPDDLLRGSMTGESIGIINKIEPIRIINKIADLPDGRLSVDGSAAPASTTVQTEPAGPCTRCGAELVRWPDGTLTANLSRWCIEVPNAHAAERDAGESC